jgi:hypothetical protein
VKPAAPAAALVEVVELVGRAAAVGRVEVVEPVGRAAAVLGAWAAVRRVEAAELVGRVARVGLAAPAVGQRVEPGVRVARAAVVARALDVKSLH